MKKIVKSELAKICLFLFILVIFGFVINSNSYIRKDMNYVNITNDAQLYYNGKLVCIGDTSKYDVTKTIYNDEIVIKKKLKNKNIKNAVITFNNIIDAAYEVKVGGERIVSFGMKAPKNSVVCNNWVCIPIGNDYNNKEIEITLRCVNGKVFARIPEILFMNCKDEEISFAVSHIEYIIIGLIFFVIGILLLLFMVVNMTFGINNKKIFYVALSSLAKGNWIFATFQVYKLFTDNNIVDFYVEYLSLGIGLLFMNFYINELYEKGIEKKILLIDRIVLVVSTILMVILQVTNVVYMNDSVVSIQLGGLVAIIMLVKYYFMEVKKNMQVSLMLFVETVTFGIIVIYYIISHVASKGIDFLNLIILCFALYILQATTRLIQEIKVTYVISAEERSVSKLAFLDTLTGISNRRGFERFISALNKEKNQKYTLCSFDLNKLKYINDTYGHMAGDTLIKNFALSLKEAIIEEEFCGRMGGDEFIAMVKIDRTQVFLDSLKQIVDKKNNEEDSEHKVSYSVGKAPYTNDDECDIDTILRIADGNMYEMKNKSNHGKKNYK